MSASLEVIEYWYGEQVLEEIMDVMDLAIAYAAHDAVLLDKIDTPVLTGALRNSKTTHSPDYATNDFDAAKSGDIFNDDVVAIKNQVVDHELAWGSWIPYAYAVHNGTSVMPARPTTLEASDLVVDNMDFYIESAFSHTQRVI